MKILKDLALGAGAGLFATYVMTKFQERRSSGKSRGTPATVKLADRVSQTLVHHPVPKENRKLSGNLVHYGFGAAMGMIYGLLNDRRRAGQLFSGTGYGTLVWILADNLLVPLMGLSKWPGKQPLKDHVSALSSHLVYGKALSRTLASEKEILT